MASVLKVDKLDPQSGTALELGTSGDTISVPSGATLDISASTLTPPATMPASSGINFTALNATNLGSGTVPTARLGSGTASSSTVLYGDQTYKAEPSGGKFLQVQNAEFINTANNTTGTSFASTFITDAITPSATDSQIYCTMQCTFYPYRETTPANNAIGKIAIYRDIDGGGFTKIWPTSGDADRSYGVSMADVGGDYTGWMDVHFLANVSFLDSPATTGVCTYTLYIAKTGTMNNMQVQNAASVYLFEIGA